MEACLSSCGAAGLGRWVNEKVVSKCLTDLIWVQVSSRYKEISLSTRPAGPLLRPRLNQLRCLSNLMALNRYLTATCKLHLSRCHTVMLQARYLYTIMQGRASVNLPQEQHLRFTVWEESLHFQWCLHSAPAVMDKQSLQEQCIHHLWSQ